MALIAPTGVAGAPSSSLPSVDAAQAPPLAGAPAAGVQRLAGSRQGGEGGEGGERGQGGQGGEMGVDPKRASSDPAAFLIALDVVRAHYLAGLDAYGKGEKDAAAEMFAHPIAEVYVDLEPVFKARGVAPFDETMTKASTLAAEGKPQEEVGAAVSAVLEALDAAAGKAPAPGGNDPKANAEAIADMIERAALQYAQARKESEGEAYLDGYGFSRAAAVRAERHLAALEKRDTGLAAAIRAALAALDKAYPSAVRPQSLDTDPGVLLAASSRVAIAAGKL